MTRIFWKPLVGMAEDGTLYVDDIYTTYEGLHFLAKITNMKRGTPISLADARRKQLSDAFSFKISWETPDSVVERSLWIQHNLIGYMEELGYQIVLKGDEYSIETSGVEYAA